MLKLFYPYEYVESVFSIDYQKLYNKGYRGLIFDIDNTLVHHGEDSNEEVDLLFKKIEKIGFSSILLSDNSKERIKKFTKNIDCPYIYEANKPNTTNFLRAVKMLDMENQKVIMIGDQILRDIYGANKSDIDSILVKYMRYDDEKKIGCRRQIEKIILQFYKGSKKYQNRIGDILTDDWE